MPLIKVIKRGKVCWKFGKEGKLYCGKEAREKATLQGRAIKRSQMLRRRRK